MLVLDAGCGPASISAGLAAAVAPGTVVALDLDLQALRSAGPRDGLELVGGDVYALPFANDTFDAIFSHATLQHLAEPARALGELYRVLRPGGTIAVADADYGGSILWPAGPRLLRSLDLMALLRPAADPFVGRKLGTLLANAGVVDIEAGATAATDGTALAVERTAAFWANFFRSKATVEACRRRNLATGAELSAIADDWIEWGATPGACWARFWCQALGTKPAETATATPPVESSR